MAGIGTVLSVTDRMTAPINSINAAMDSLMSTMQATDATSVSMFEGATINIENFNNELENGDKAATGLIGTLKKVAAAAGVIGGIKFAFNWAQETFEAANTQLQAEAMLKSVMAATGGTEEAFNKIIKKAGELQKTTIYGDEAYIAGAAELSTYLSDGEAVLTMMDTLSNYATGMSSGEALDTKGMTDMATQLGKALEGSYDGLTKKGFVLTDQQKEIIKNGTEMERALTLSEVINESWEGLAENMANLPSGQMQQMVNSWGDVKEIVGQQLQPVIATLFAKINQNMPKIEKALVVVSNALKIVINICGKIIDALASVYDYVAANSEIVIAAVGTISGAVMTACAFIYNVVASVVNGVIDIGIDLWNYIAIFANFFANVWTDPLDSIVRAYVDFVDVILGLLETVAGAFDMVFGSTMADSVKGWRDNLQQMTTDVLGERAVDLRITDKSAYHKFDERWAYGDAFMSGYDWGEEFARSLGTEETTDYLSQIALNTSATAEEVTAANTETIAWLRDLAEREAINRFTTAEVTVQVGGVTNNVNGTDGSIDGFVTKIADALGEQLSITAAAYNADF